MSQPIVDASQEESRRSFMGRTALTTVAATTAAILAHGATANAAYPGAKFASLYPGWNARNYMEIQADENTHVATLVSLLGSNARPIPNFKNLNVGKNVNLFISYSYAFENTGAGAYLGATPYIFSKSYLADAASIALVEAYHSGYINTLVNFPIVPGGSSFATPFTIPQVLSNIANFVVDLNGGPPLTFSTTPSDANDIEILNFALALEYLEREFYNINVPVLFG